MSVQHLTGGIEPGGLAAENALYTRLGRVLLQMLGSGREGSWSEILLHVDHVVLPDAREAYVMETTLVLQGGERLPLVARPEVMDLSRELLQLCREQSGKVWKAYDYRLFHDERGPGFQCRYTYPARAH